MYPDQVTKIREMQHARATADDALFYRRQQAEIYLARRFRFRNPSVAEKSALDFWVLFGGRRPWGI